MASPALQSRLAALSTTHKQTIPLIHRLQNFPSSVGQGDDARLELSAEIHLRLKEIEEELEMLRVETEQLEAIGNNRKRENDPKDLERERTVAMMRKLEEDLKSARTRFRKAQLEAKKSAEAAKRKERQLLFAGVEEGGGGGGRRKGVEKFTHDDLVVNASNDVTSALRRTHQLMQAELSRSQFAQETLDQSTTALKSLSESYTNLDTLLASSRSLVSSLLRSQKSDTWYLETAVYILVGTIIWLLFRRIFYGPLWWLVWLPLKLAYRTIFTVLGAVGLSSGVAQANSVGAPTPLASSYSSTPSWTADAAVKGGPEQSGQQNQKQEDESMSEKIGKMAEESRGGTNVDDISPDERRRQEEMPRNPKKRMHEEPIAEGKKDEL